MNPLIHPKAKRMLDERARSVPHQKSFFQAVLFSAFNYLCILAAATTLFAYCLTPTHLASRVLVVCIVFVAITWLLSFFKRRTTHCPLCKGTPLVNSGALPHKKALKIWPCNHGVSATLSIIATQTFRCMYCGTLFDLMKAPSHFSGKDPGKNDTDYTQYTPDERA